MNEMEHWQQETRRCCEDVKDDDDVDFYEVYEYNLKILTIVSSVDMKSSLATKINLPSIFVKNYEPRNNGLNVRFDP